MTNRRYRFLIAVCAALVVSSAAQARADSLVVVVRHAEKASTPADDPDLTADGKARAATLGAALAGARIDTIITTQYLRTRNTAAPLARALALTPVVVSGGVRISDHAAEVAKAVRARPDGSSVLVVGHSNTVPAIIAALGGPQMDDLCDGEFSTLFVLTIRTDGTTRLVRSNYGVPDPPAAAPCGKSMQVPGMRP